MTALRITVALAAGALRTQLQYRVSMAMQLVGNLLVTAADVLALWALFARFGSVRGWDVASGLLLYGTVSLGFAIASLVGDPFEDVGRLVRGGELDAMLLRPGPLAAQIVGAGFALRRIGRLLQAVAVFVVGIVACRQRLDATSAMLLAGAVPATATLFLGVFVLAGAWVVRAVEGAELVNCLSYGGATVAQYPMEVYPRRFRRFFTLVVPVAPVSYAAVASALHRGGSVTATTASLLLLAGPMFLAAAAAIWSASVRAYRSTGS